MQTFQEFVASKVQVADIQAAVGFDDGMGVRSGYVYDGGYLEDAPEGAGGKYFLLIERSEWVSDDLDELERILWAHHVVWQENGPLAGDDIMLFLKTYRDHILRCEISDDQLSEMATVQNSTPLVLADMLREFGRTPYELPPMTFGTPKASFTIDLSTATERVQWDFKQFSRSDLLKACQELRDRGSVVLVYDAEEFSERFPGVDRAAVDAWWDGQSYGLERALIEEAGDFYKMFGGPQPALDAGLPDVEKYNFLVNHGWIVGTRDKRVHTDHAGAFMCSEPYSEAQLPTKDGANGPWAIVGDDLVALVDEAYGFLKSEVDANA